MTIPEGEKALVIKKYFSIKYFSIKYCYINTANITTYKGRHIPEKKASILITIIITKLNIQDCI